MDLFDRFLRVRVSEDTGPASMIEYLENGNCDPPDGLAAFVRHFMDRDNRLMYSLHFDDTTGEVDRFFFVAPGDQGIYLQRDDGAQYNHVAVKKDADQYHVGVKDVTMPDTSLYDHQRIYDDYATEVDQEEFIHNFAEEVRDQVPSTIQLELDMDLPAEDRYDETYTVSRHRDFEQFLNGIDAL